MWGKLRRKRLLELREREKLWVSRCRPYLREDVHGVSRYVYAAPRLRIRPLQGLIRTAGQYRSVAPSPAA